MKIRNIYKLFIKKSSTEVDIEIKVVVCYFKQSKSFKKFLPEKFYEEYLYLSVLNLE